MKAITKQDAIVLTKSSQEYVHNPFTCTECGTIFPSHDFWSNGDVCDFCMRDWDYISWRLDQIDTELHRKIIPKTNSKKGISIDKRTFYKFLNERNLKVVYKQWQKEMKQKISKNSSKNAI